MPWSNQSGGGGGPWGGGGGGNGGGPWGQGPQGPRGGPGGTPPDLEDIFRRGQDRLKQAFPGGGNRGVILLGIVAILGLWLFKAVYTVQPDQLAVQLLFGKPEQAVAGPGLHFHWWPVETYRKAQIAEKQINIGGNGARGSSEGLMLSGDQNIVDVQFSLLYRVSDPKAYLFDVENPDEMVRQVAESAMREIVGRRPAQDVFRDDRAGIAKDVRKIVQDTLNEYGAGIDVTAVSIEDAAPPREVADAFDEVQRAEQDEDRFVQEANKYANKELGQARGQAAQIREDAAAYKNRVVQEADGEAQRFLSVYNAYAKAPAITRKRIYLETMENVLSGTNKVILEKGGASNVLPYLPLPGLQSSSGTGKQSGSTSRTGSTSTGTVIQGAGKQ
jgi:membrane protease subunit HflK